MINHYLTYLTHPAVWIPIAIVAWWILCDTIWLINLFYHPEPETLDHEYAILKLLLIPVVGIFYTIFGPPIYTITKTVNFIVSTVNQINEAGKQHKRPKKPPICSVMRQP